MAASILEFLRILASMVVSSYLEEGGTQSFTFICPQVRILLAASDDYSGASTSMHSLYIKIIAQWYIWAEKLLA